MITITFPADGTTLNFFGVGEPANFHTELTCFPSGSYWCSHDSSPMITYSRNASPPSAMTRSTPRNVSTCTAFSSGVNRRGTQRTQTRVIWRCSCIIVKTLPYEILNALLRLRNVINRSSQIIAEAVLILTSVTAEAMTPGPPSLTQRTRQSLKSMNHLNTVT